MTVEDARYKIREYCKRMHDCRDCELHSVELNCWNVIKYGSYEEVEKLYNILTYGTADVTRNIAEISDAFICGKCGICLEDCVSVEYDEDTEDTTYHVYEFKFCPECGRKVVEE